MPLIPLTDASRPLRRFPAVTAGLIAANGLGFLLEILGGEAFVTRWTFIPADVAAGHHWMTVLTAMFLHGSWSHILGNMVFLWAFGPEIEDMMGRPRYLAFYLLGGVAAALAQIAGDPASTVPSLGASGAIAAVMGAFVVTYPHDRIRSLLVIFVFVRVAYIPAVLLIGVWFLSQLMNLGALSAAPAPAGGVAYAAHVGGFIFGTIATRLFGARPRFGSMPRGY